MSRWCNILVAVALLLTIVSCSSDEEKKISHFQKGKAYFEKENYKAAQLELKNALQIDPEFVEAYRYLGDTNLKLGDIQGAFAAYQKLVTLDPDDIDAQLKMATFYMLARKLEDARSRLESILEKDPDNVKAMILMAGLLANDGADDEAAGLYRKVMHLDGGDQNAVMGLARTLLKQQKLDEAETLLKQAISKSPTVTKFHIALFGVAIKKGDTPAAEKVLASAIEANPESVDLFILQGNFYLLQHEELQAEAAFNKAISHAGSSIKPYMASASFYSRTGRPDQAEAMYREALERSPGNISVMEQFARFYLERGDLVEAKGYIGKILDVRPKYFPARILQGEIAVSQRQYSEALEIFNQLEKEEPESYYLHYFVGLANLGVRNNSQAEVALRRSVELNPGFVKPIFLLADLYNRERRFVEAENEIAPVLATQPENYQAILITGTSLMGQGKYIQAEEFFRKLIRTDPDNPTGYYRLGVLNRVIKQDRAALADFQRALDISPKLMDALGQIVLIHALEKEYDLALAACSKQLDMLTDSPRHQAIVFNFMGNLYAAKKENKKAEASFQEALDKDPNLLSPYLSLAKIYLSDNNTDKAIAQYEKALAKKSEQPGIHMMLGTIYDMSKEYALSEEHYRKALELKPDFAPAANNLAYLLVVQGKNLDMALGLAQKARELVPDDPAVMDTLGWIYFNKGLYDNAIRELTESRDKKPESALIRYHLGRALYARGDTAAGLQELEQALALSEDFDGAAEARQLISKNK